MLAEEEVRERATFCLCALLQLGWLYDNDSVEPHRYLDYLKGSSLHLGSDEFLTSTIQDALAQQQPDGGLKPLLALYEGFVHALCEVLETDPQRLMKDISPEFLEQLAAEVGVELDFGGGVSGE
jgi:hypothetical protein